METDVLFALLLITALAAVIPVLARRLDRFGVPIVVYEIIAGIIVGRSGLNLIEPSHILTFLAEFGFAFLMFLSGLELDLRLLRPSRPTTGGERRWTQALPLGILIFLGTLTLAFTATTLFAPPGASSNPLLLGLILSTTSLGVVVPVLKEFWAVPPSVIFHRRFRHPAFAHHSHRHFKPRAYTGSSLDSHSAADLHYGGPRFAARLIE